MSQEVLYICVYNVQIKWTTLFVKEADNLEKSSTFCEISKNTHLHILQIHNDRLTFSIRLLTF